MEIETALLRDLPEEQRRYLLDLAKNEGKSEIPVYYRNCNGGVFFIKDYILRDNKTFEKTAPVGLYRGGALLKLLTREGQVMIYDERPNAKWLRLVGGIARFSEGADLTKTAVREAVIEELAVLDKKETVRLVPEKTKDLVGLSIPGWGITVEGIVETGALMVVDYFFNDANRAFEVVVQWDLCSWEDLIILHSEDWFRGGRSGFTPSVINSQGYKVGEYDGRHGYSDPCEPALVKRFHPTALACL